jgi:hypothetical protein
LLAVFTLAVTPSYAQDTPAAKPAAQSVPSDRDITDAYVYLLGRWIILRQQRLDFEKGGFEWNTLVHHDPGGVDWVNPNLDVAYTEAWVAVDEYTCVLLEIPRIEGRYYTWEMLNGWGEVVLNINERTFPKRPYGEYALCLKGGDGKIPDGARRVDLPARTTRVLTRSELGADPKEALRLQHEFKLTPLGKPKIDPVIRVPVFPIDKLPGVEAFDLAPAILAGELDINPGMEKPRALVRAVEALVKSETAGRQRVDNVIKTRSMPEFMGRTVRLSVAQNGWVRATIVGNYGSDYWMRTIVGYVGLWANNTAEVVYFGHTGLDGGASYTRRSPRVLCRGTR